MEKNSLNINVDLTWFPKWVEIYECFGGPFLTFRGGYRVLGPPYYKFRCKRCRSIFGEYDLTIGEDKCLICGYGG